MCWSVPGKLVNLIDDRTGIVEITGLKKKISLDLVPGVKEGEYVLVHAGYAIQKVDEEKARFTIDFFNKGMNNA